MIRSGAVGMMVLVGGWLSGCGERQGPTGLSHLGGLGVSDAALRREVEATLGELEDSEYAVVRSHVLESYAALGGEQAVGAIGKGLTDEEAMVRFAATVAAGDLRARALRGMLERRLRDENSAVRLGAAYGLERLGDHRFGVWFAKALTGDDATLQGQACMLLGRLGNEEGWRNTRGMLWRTLREANDRPAVRLQAAEALARLGDERVEEKLLAYAGSGYADDRILAIEALRHMDLPTTRAMLHVLAEDDQREVQLAAIRALGERAEQEHVELVRESVRYRDAEGRDVATARVRGLALLALGATGEREDTAELVRMMQEGSAYVRVAAARGAIDYLERAE